MERQFWSAGLLCLLAYLSYYDCKYMKIPVFPCVIAGLGAVWPACRRGDFWLDLLPGIFFLALAFLSKEKVGYGDGMVLLVLGLCMGFWNSLGIIFLGLLFSAFFSLGRILKKSCKPIPFLPFLLLALEISFIYT